MRDFLVSILPDPGTVILLIPVGLCAYVLTRMLTDERRYEDPVEHDTDRPTKDDPESDARTRGF